MSVMGLCLFVYVWNSSSQGTINSGKISTVIKKTSLNNMQMVQKFIIPYTSPSYSSLAVAGHWHICLLV